MCWNSLQDKGCELSQYERDIKVFLIISKRLTVFTCKKDSLKTELVAVDPAGGDVTVPRGG